MFGPEAPPALLLAPTQTLSLSPEHSVPFLICSRMITPAYLVKGVRSLIYKYELGVM